MLSGIHDINDLLLQPWTIPAPAADEVQIAVQASAINFGDVLCVRGLYPNMPDYPFVPGSEVAGVIEAVGSQVTGLQIGDPVVALTGIGGHASHVNVPAASVVPKPQALTFEQACSLPIVFWTVAHAFEVGRLSEGERVLIHTATGGCGLMALQLARLKGCLCYGSSSRSDKREILRQLGVPHCLDYKTEFDIELRRMTDGRGVDLVLNTIAGEGPQRGLNSLAPHGRYLELALHALKSGSRLDLSRLLQNQSIHVIDLGQSWYSTEPDDPQQRMFAGRWALESMGSLLDTGRIVPIVSRIYPFEQAPQALQYVSEGGHIGKVVLSHQQDRMVDTKAECLQQLQLQAQRAEQLSARPVGRPTRQPVPTARPESPAPIAVIGMAGQFPRARNLQEFWDNLSQGRNCVTEVPADRWAVAHFYDPDPTVPGKTNSKWMGALQDADKFDPLFFSISPAEAAAMDPQQRLFLECAWHCVEDAGVRPSSLAGSRCGVFVGCSGSDYGAGQGEGAQSLTGGAASILSARIAYFLDLKGPCMAIDTACSSSLVAIIEACNSLAAGNCDLSLAGGVSVMAGPSIHIMGTQAKMLSPDGACRAFDQGANGIVPGEGVGILLLKRLDDALRDGDRIDAVIRGWGINQDGKTNGITAPSVKSQIALQREVYQRFEIDPEGITLVEGHGTGTVMGDPIEVEALSDAFGGYTSKRQYCALGSVKSNIGHLMAAAGVAGAVKAILSMQHQQLPPSLHFHQCNERIALDDSPFFVNRQLLPWHSETGQPRRAAVNSFGFSGTNAHLVLEEHRGDDPIADDSDSNPERPAIIVLSAKSPQRLHDAARRLRQHLLRDESGLHHDLHAIAYTLQTGRDAMAERLGMVVRSIPQLLDMLTAFVERPGTVDGIVRGRVQRDKASQGAHVQADSRIDETDYVALLTSWIEGEFDDWRRLYRSGSPQPVRLPGYPFARDRYWLPQGIGEPLPQSQPPSQTEARVMAFQPVLKAQRLETDPEFEVATLVCLLSAPDSRQQFMQVMQRLAPQVRVLFVSRETGGQPGVAPVYHAPGGDDEELQQTFARIREEQGPVDALLDLWTLEAPQEVRDPMCLLAMLQALAASRLKPGRLLLAGPGQEALDRCYIESWVGIEKSLGMVLPDTRMTVIGHDTLAPDGSPQALQQWTELLWSELQGRATGSVWYRDGRRMVHAIQPVELDAGRDGLLKQRGTYLITGGCGGLGRLFARHLAEACEARLILTGRSPLTAEIQAHIDGLRQVGAEVFYLQADVADEAAMRAGLQQAMAQMGVPNGVLHAAGVAGGRALVGQRPEDFAQVLKPKVQGTRVLDRVLDQLPLDFVCYFSSSSALLGDLGSCDYALANRFQLAYAEYRNRLVAQGRRRGRSIAICWPLWRDGGMALADESTRLYLESSGQRLLERQQGLELFQSLLSQGATQQLLLVGEPTRIQRMLGLAGGPPPAVPLPLSDQNRPELPGLTPEESLRWELKALVSRQLGIDRELLDEQLNLVDFGFDSISLAAFARTLAARYQIEITPAVFFGHANLQALAQHLMTEYPEAIQEAYPERLGSVRQTRGEAAVKRSASADCNPTPAAPGQREPIAIIGMSGRFPQARDINALWEILAQGRDAVSEIPADRFDWRQVYGDASRDPGKTNGKWCGAIPGVAEFDPAFFEISPREAETLDPRQRHLLQETWKALENAGYGPKRLQGQRVGLFVGAEEGDYGYLGGGGSVTANHSGILAGRAAFFLNLHGPTMTINTACSSSLVAAHQAILSLRSGECDIALVAGVNLMLSPQVFVGMAQAGMLSPDGTCYAFDERANGLVPGDAIAVVVLKRLDRAETDGDSVRAVVVGSGINFDGKTNGITAPNGVAQSELVQTVYDEHGIDPERIDYIVTHGTGTKLGDPVEVDALHRAFKGRDSRLSACALTSTKSNLGHSFAASGLVSLIGLVEALRHRQIPPSLHCETANNYIPWGETPFYVNQQLRPWPERGDAPLMGAVSAFGMSGTNAHMVLRSYQREQTPELGTSEAAPGYFLLALSAKTPEALQRKIHQMVGYLEQKPPSVPQLQRISYTLLAGRHHFAHRCAVVVTDGNAALETWQQIGQQQSPNCVQGAVPREFRRLEALEQVAADLPEQCRLGARNTETYRDALLTLADLYCKGYEPAWERLFDDPPPRVMELPTYPFARDTYWVSGAALVAEQPAPEPAPVTATRDREQSRPSPRVALSDPGSMVAGTFNAPTARKPRLAGLPSTDSRVEAAAEAHPAGLDPVHLGEGIWRIQLPEIGDPGDSFTSVIAGLRHALAAVAENAAAKVVILSTPGRFLAPGNAQQRDAFFASGDHLLTLQCPLPVIAAVAGPAHGLGWLVACLSDFLLCSEAADVGYLQVCGDGQPVPLEQALFARRFDAPFAEALLTTSRTWSGAALQGLDLAIRVTPEEQLEGAVLALARQLAACPREPLVQLKAHLAEPLAELAGQLQNPDLATQPMSLHSGIERSNIWLQAAQSADAEPGLGQKANQPKSIPVQSSVLRLQIWPDGVVLASLRDTADKNQFSADYVAGLAEAFRFVADNPECRVMILTGYEQYFACGGTREGVLSIQDGSASYAESPLYEWPLRCEIPVIAAMQGHAIGAGWSMGMFCDLPLFSEESVYNSRFMGYGFTPGFGSTLIFPHRLGQDLGREVLFSAREYKGWELRDRGMALPVLPRAEVLEQALGMAHQIASLPRAELIRLKQHNIQELSRRLPEIVRREVRMHEQTFVGNREVLERIERQFSSSTSDSDPGQGTVTTADSPQTDERLLPVVLGQLSDSLAHELHMDSQTLDQDQPFTEAGLDSITGVTWIRSINEHFGLDLAATDVYNHPTLRKFARYVVGEIQNSGASLPLPGAGSEVTAAPHAETETPQNPASEPHHFSRSASQSEQQPDARGEKEAIAVIGMFGRFPQSPDLQTFWENLEQGRDCISEVPGDRWPVERFFDPDPKAPGKSYSKWLGTLEDVDKFDPLFFNISPLEAESMDPQQRLFLEACWGCIEDAGYKASSLSGSLCGVFAGCGTSDYGQLLQAAAPSAQGLMGSAISILAARISYLLNLQGPCLAIETACSSSLVAIATACDSLISGGSDLALAGGVSVMAGPGMHIMTSKAGMLSPDGRCHAFDQGANGFVLGEGVGVVLLKRLSDALRDGDRIDGVIRGWGVNQDGKTNGITAPNGDAQSRLQRQVYDSFGIDPNGIQLIEAHGTGTKLGDPIEVAGLKATFAEYTRNPGYCALGSVKSNIGHLLAAAGVAGFLKILLALRHRKLPPTIQFEQLNEHVRLEGSPFYINTSCKPWAVAPGESRRAAISSFGFSGTNAHLVVDEFVEDAPQPSTACSDSPVMILLSARDEERLGEAAANLCQFVTEHTVSEKADATLDEIAYTLQVGREAMEERLGLIAHTPQDLIQKLTRYISDGQLAPEVYRGTGATALDLSSDDDDLQRTLVAWLAKRKYAKLLQLWVRGMDPDWQALYTDPRPRRVSLPTYPFARDRYWVDAFNRKPALPEAGPVLHPLLHENRSDFETQCFRSTFSGSECFLSDHRIQGLKALPGVAYLEMAVQAAVRSVRCEPPAVRLRDVVWSRPVTVETTPQSLQLRLAPDPHGTIRFEVCSEAESWDEIAVVHSQGRVELVASEQPVVRNLEELQQSCSQDRLAAEQCYAAYQAMGIEYGPTHRCIEEIRIGSGEVLVRLRLPAAEQNGDAFFLHPGVMDSAIQGAIGLLSTGADGAAPLPFALDTLELFAPTPRAGWALIRPTEGDLKERRIEKIDLELMDDSGVVCVRMSGFSSRPFSPAEGATKRDGLMVAVPDWSEALAAPTQASPGAEHHLVLLCDFAPHRARLQEALPEARCLIQAGSEAVEADQGVADAYQRAAGRLMEALKGLLKAGDGGRRLLQVVVASEGEGSLFVGLSGLLKTARAENPLLQGQLIELESDIEPERLQAAVRDAAQIPECDWIRYRDGTRLLPCWRQVDVAKPAQSLPWKAAGVYLISGGMGGLGLIFAREVIERVPDARLLLTGRSALDEARREALQALQNRGAEVEYRQVDVSIEGEVADLVAELLDRWGRIDGIIHSAGVIRDSFILKKSAADLAAVLAPKVQGLVNLDCATRELPLGFLVSFSAGAGVTGNPGQADYAAANAFMDAYAHYRHRLVEAGRRSGTSLSINWPLWAEGGMEVDPTTEQWLAERSGMTAMATRVGIEAFYHAFYQARSAGQPQVLVMYGALQRLRAMFSGATDTARSGIEEAPAPSPLAETGDADPVDLAFRLLRSQMAETLKLPPDKIEPDQPLERYGIDSIMVTALTSELEKRFGPLSKTLFFEYETLREVARYFAQTFPQQLNPPASTASRPAGDRMDQPAEPLESHRRAPVQALSRLPLFNPKRPVAASSGALDIAIVGLAGRYPQSPDLQAYWENLRDGRDCVGEIPMERWDWREYYSDDPDRPGLHSSKWGGFISDVDKFDPLFFNISPREAEYIDPQERLFLEQAWMALEDAGYTRSALQQMEAEQWRAQVGVYVGVMYGEYQLYGAESSLQGRPMGFAASLASIANRVSYALNLHGPSLTLDTMCSSSLTSIHLACQDLKLGRTRMAIAGGVNLTIHPNKYLMLSRGQMMSSRGRCESFGEGGDGYVPGEGVGAVVLKRLEDAERDGDSIYAVIKGSAINHGGRANGYSVPNPKAQRMVVAQALEESGVDPRTVSYLEAHGTGTRLGDPIEITGLNEAFGHSGQQDCWIGSVKSNIGHCESAAGIAGVSKVLLQMRHGQIAPSLHADALNPNIDFSTTRFSVNRQLRDWPRPVVDGRPSPRIAGISSFGAGGSNAHMVIQEYPRAEAMPSTPPAGLDQRPAVVVLSAKNEPCLCQVAQRLKTFLTEGGNGKSVDLYSVAYTLQVGREPMEERLAFTAGSVDELIRKLDGFLLNKAQAVDLHRGQAQGGREALALLTSDQEMGELLDRWMQAGKYDRLLELWVKGLQLDWDRLYTTQRPRRVSLPTYPFARERYWIETAEGTTRSSSTQQMTAPSGDASDDDQGPLIFEEIWTAGGLEQGETAEIQTLICFLSQSDRQQAMLQTLASMTPHSNVVFIADRGGNGDLRDGICEVSRSDPDSYTRAFEQIQENHKGPLALLYLWPLETSRDATDPRALATLLQALTGVGLTPRRILCASQFDNPLTRCYQEAWIGFERSLRSLLPQIPITFALRDASEADSDWSMERWTTTLWDELGSRVAQSSLYQAGRRLVSQIRPIRAETTGAPPLKQGGCYLITGGLGGLGYLLAEHLARDYAANLVLTGRSECSEEHSARLSRLQSFGGQAVYLQADVCDADAMAAGLKSLPDHLSTFNGVIHAAGIEGGESLFSKDLVCFQRVLAPKIEGTLLLDELLQDQALDFVCYFSSSSAILGDFGSCDYAIGNRFQNAYARYRNQRAARGDCSGRTLSLNWPLWRAGGMSERDRESNRVYLATSGQRYLEADEGLALFGQALSRSPAQQLILVGQRRSLHRLLGLEKPPAAPRGGASSAVLPGPAGPEGDNASLDERICDDLATVVGELLKISRERLDRTANFADFGFDSISLAALAKALSERYAIAITPVLFLAHTSLQKLSQYLAAEHAQQMGGLFVTSSESATSTHADPSIPPEAPVTGPADDTEPMAIIGMSGRFPQANSVQGLWENWRDGRNCITEVPAERWDWRALEKAFEPGAAGARFGAFLNDIDRFDPLFFELSPREAAEMDPQQRLFLEEAWHTFEDAGYLGERIRGACCGIYVGVEESAYGLLGADSHQLTSNQNATLAARIAYALDLKGPNLALTAACSSGLVALHQACLALRQGDCDMALVGGVSLLVSPLAYLGLNRAGLLSPSGRCQVFDRQADGLVPGEAVASVLLKPLSRAMADGDRIYGCIKASGVNHDGRSNGITAPNPLSQADLLQRVLQRQQIDPGALQYVLAHSVGSQIGDAAEIEAYSDAFRRFGNKARFCSLGSMKPLIGHTFAASGIVGVIGLLMAMQHRIKPGLPGYESSNTYIDLDRSPFEIERENQPWVREAGQPRLAMVGSTGVSGTNAYAVIEEVLPAVRKNPPQRRAAEHLIPLSARNHERLQVMVRQLRDYVAEQPDLSLGDLAYTLQVGREPMPERLALVCSSLHELHELLDRAVSGAETSAEQPPNLFSQTGDELASEAQIQDAIATRQLPVLAQAWVTGARVPWEALHTGQSPRLIAAPLYPFVRRRCWLDVPEAAQSSPSAPGLNSAIDSKAEALYTYLARGSDVEPMAEFLTFCPFPKRVPGFSMSRLFVNPSRYPDEWDLVREKQIEMRQVLFFKESLGQLSTALDIGCGHGTDVVQMTSQFPNLRMDGFTIARAQAELGNRRIQEMGLEQRARIYHSDSTKDPFPATYDLMIGIEVCCHINDKNGLFANMAAALEDDGRVLLIDFVANLEGAIVDPDIDIYIPTRDEWVALLATHHLVLDEVIDVSPQVANYLYDPEHEQNTRDLPEVLRASLQSYANSALSIQRGWLGYYLFKLRIERESDIEACRSLNARRLAEPTSYPDALKEMLDGGDIPYPRAEMERCHQTDSGGERSEPAPAQDRLLDLESTLIDLTARLLGFEPEEIQSIGNFREMGVSSINAVELVQQINGAYQLHLPSNVIFECPTPAKLAQRISAERDLIHTPSAKRLAPVEVQTRIDKPEPPVRHPELVQLNEVVNGRPVFWFHGGHGGVDNYRELAEQINRPFYGIQARGYLSERSPLRGIQAMAAYYVSVIQSVQSAGPYDLGGYSLGGTLAYEVTRQLQELGESVATLVMLDALDSAGAVAGRFSKHSELLQIVNGELHAGVSSAADDPASVLIHRDEVDATLNEKAYLNRLIELAKARGLKRSKDHIRERYRQLAQLHDAFELDRFSVLPLPAPEAVHCYYFRNGSGRFFGDMEPYFTTTEDAAALDHVDYWSEWQRELSHFRVQEVAASNHMVLLSEPEPRDTIIDFCRALYSTAAGPSRDWYTFDNRPQDRVEMQ